MIFTLGECHKLIPHICKVLNALCQLPILHNKQKTVAITILSIKLIESKMKILLIGTHSSESSEDKDSSKKFEDEFDDMNELMNTHKH